MSSIIVVALQRLFIQAKDIKKYYELSIPDMVSQISFSVTVITSIVCASDFGLYVTVDL